MMKLSISIICFIIFLNSFSFSSENTIIGNARVLDADTIVIKEKKIRLFGIDAPELDQKCLDNKSKHYSCGKESKEFLTKIIKKNNIVKCFYSKKDIYKRILGNCFVDNLNLNSHLVRNGHALAYLKYSDKYLEHQKYAKFKKLGMWKGSFIKPEDWRRKYK